jgi:PhnB protein
MNTTPVQERFAMIAQPYLNFDGRCEEALNFYRQAIGAETTMLLRMKDSPEPCDPSMMPPGSENKVMHCSFKIGESTLMASDCSCAGTTKFEGFSISLTAADPDHAAKLFAALSDGGQVQMPLGKTFFSPSFGVLVDRFGLSWMVYVEQPQG